MQLSYNPQFAKNLLSTSLTLPLLSQGSTSISMRATDKKLPSFDKNEALQRGNKMERN